ncbi:hypothetical protein Tco_1078822 [Tanacetum coccineum]|uniref:Uncharacterized protein n=1 Tax=Tanacetum coccineum TaxID=301880 RepID=A0ABQ5HRN1_9ASTR
MKSSLIMGKNTWLKRSIAQHAPATGNNAFVGLVPHLVGKVGLVMTSRDPEDMRFILWTVFCRFVSCVLVREVKGRLNAAVFRIMGLMIEEYV